MRYISLIALLFACSGVFAFNYYTEQPFGVGVEIEPIKPEPEGEGEYSIVQGSLPPGIVFDPKTGVISGTPTTKGYYYFTISKTGDDTPGYLYQQVYAQPVINCGVSELTISTPISTTIMCATSGDEVIDNGWTITPASLTGVTLSKGLITFDKFYPDKDMEITVIGKGYAHIAKTSFKVKKLANPTYEDGVYVLAHDLKTIKCEEYTTDIDSYNHAEVKFPNLDGLTDKKSWSDKIPIFASTITTMNATMNGLIDIQESGEYTFYMQTGNNMNARVMVNNVQILSDWGKCNAWNDNPITNTTTLEKGYATVYIEIRGGEGLDFKFVLQYSTPNDSTKKSIPFKYAKPFRPVSFLNLDEEKISWLNDAFSLTPIHVRYGKATSCELTSGTLPEGSQVTTEAITGHPQADMDYQTYKMTCKNEFSVTNEVTFQLRVTSITINGLVAYFYKPRYFDISLNTKYGPSVDGIEPYYIQAVDDARIEEGTGGTSFPEGTNADFYDDYGVYFEGYLKIGKNQAGKYNFKLQGEGGYWLYIDNKLIVEKPGRNRYDTETIVDFELTDDYYFYQIYYVTHNGDAHFEIASKLETSDKWDGFITDVFVPSYDYFVFKQRYATYLVGQGVENPIIEIGLDSVSCKNVAVNPQLPEGLIAGCSLAGEVSALIGGVVTSYSELTEYVVSITDLDDKVHSYPVTIAVKDEPDPSGFSLKDVNTGKEYFDGMNLQIGKYYDLKVNIRYGKFRRIELTNNGLVGFSWDPEKYILSGTAREPLTAYGMTFKVKTSGADKFFIFTFTANNTCENGLVMHSFRMTSNSSVNMQGVRIIVREGDAGDFVITYVSSDMILLPHTEFKCLKIGYYTIQAYGYDDYTFEVYSSGYKVYKTDTYVTQTTNIKDMVNTKYGAPTFKYYTNTILEYIGYDILLVPQTEGYYVEEYTINNELPKGLFFSSKTGRIWGAPEERFGEYTYTIKAINDYSPAVFKLSIEVRPYDNFDQICAERYKGIVLTVITQVEEHPNDMGYRLFSSNGSLIIERVKGSFVANKTYNIRRCIQPDWYNLQLVDYSNYGWKSGNVQIKVGNSIIGKYVVDLLDSDGIRNITMHIAYYINDDTEWQYSQSYVDGWMFSNSTVAGGWPKSKISSLKRGPSTPTYYLRTQLTVEKNKYTGYLLRYSHKAGVIVRINGIEVFRENLPSGNIDANTYATQSLPLAVERKFILPIKDLEEGGVISFEIHNSATDNNFPSEEHMFLLPLDGDNEEDCILLPIYDGKITESSSKSCKENPYCVDKAFDIATAYASYWEDDYGNVQSQSFATLKFGDNGYYGFNQFYLAATTDHSKDHYPNQVKVFGLQGIESNLLSELYPVYYFKDSEDTTMSRATFNNDPYKLYTGMKIEIPKSNQPTTPYKMTVFEIGYQLCRYKTCKADAAQLLPVGEANHIYDVNCTEGGEGIRKFYCSNLEHWINIENRCSEKPTFIDPPAIKTFKTGQILNDEALFFVSGSGITYTNSLGDAFIPGLKFDKLSGHVSGTPTKADSYPVTFTISNQYGSSVHSMVIIIEEGGNDIIVEKIESPLTLTQFQKYEKVQVLWVKNTLPVKYYATKLPAGLSINVDTGMISGTPEVEGEGDYTITIKNDKSSKEVNIRIIVTTNDDATIVRSESKIDLEYLKGYSNFKPLVCSGKGITYKVDKELPKDLVYDSNTGAFSGQVFADPQSAIDYVFTCTSSNGKSQKVSIPISVNRDADSPILVNKKEKVELTVGDDLVNEKWFEVTGEDLSYNYDVLPMGIELGEKSGLINGYPKEPFRSRDATFYVKNKNDKTISFEIGITVKPSEKPVIPDSSVYKNVSIPTGKPVSEKIFDVVGGDVFVSSIDPPLPSGFSINAQGYLQGLAVYDVAKTTYKITLSDAKGKSTIVEIPLEFVSMKCTAENDYAATPVGETAVKKCGGGKTGFIQRKCLSVDGKAVWQKEIDECSSSNTGALIGIIIGCIIGGGVIFLGGYCIYVRLGGTTKHVRKTAEHIVDTKDSGVRI